MEEKSWYNDYNMQKRWNYTKPPIKIIEKHI